MAQEAPDADLEQPEIGDVEALKEPEAAVQPSANMPMLQARILSLPKIVALL